MVKKAAEQHLDKPVGVRTIEERCSNQEPVLTREELDEPGKVNVLKKIEDHEVKEKLQKDERKLEELRKQSLVLFSEASRRVEGVRGFKVNLLRKIEEEIEKGNNLLNSSANKEEITEFLNEFNVFLASFNGKESYEGEVEMIIGGEMRPQQVIVNEKVVQSVLSLKEDEINSLRGKLEDLEEKLMEEEPSIAESSDSSFDNEVASTPISEVEKQAIIKYLDSLILEVVPPGIKNRGLVRVRETVFNGEVINYSQKISVESNQQGVEKIRARVVDTVFYYVNNLKRGSGRPTEAKKVLKNFANILKKEVETELEINFTDLPVEQQNLLRIGEEVNSARKLTENK